MLACRPSGRLTHYGASTPVDRVTASLSSGRGSRLGPRNCALLAQEGGEELKAPLHARLPGGGLNRRANGHGPTDKSASNSLYFREEYTAAITPVRLDALDHGG